VLDAVARTVGVLAELTVCVALPEQPLVVPLTVYVVVLAGATVMLAPGKLPGCQV
jgi:hypothetical protein